MDKNKTYSKLLAIIGLVSLGGLLARVLKPAFQEARQTNSSMEENKTSDSKETPQINWKERYPSVTLAYELALKAHATGIDRANIWALALERSLVWGTTITLAVLGAAVTKGVKIDSLQFCNPWFTVAVISVTAIILISIVGRIWGGIDDWCVNDLREQHLHKSEE